MTWFEDIRRSCYQDWGKLLSKMYSNWLSRSSWYIYDWVCASGLRYYFTCNLLDFRFRPLEYGYSRAYPQGIDQLYPTLITLGALGKESMIDKQERGVENCLLQVIFYLRDFHLASYACVIDIGDNVLIGHIRKLTRCLIWMKRFSRRKVSIIHANVQIF